MVVAGHVAKNSINFGRVNFFTVNSLPATIPAMNMERVFTQIDTNEMFSEELLRMKACPKQTVNRWIREKGWKTEKFPGVKGGRARLILVDTQVCEFIQNTPAFHNTPMLMEAEERIAEYAPGARAPAYRQIINAIDNMTDIEQEKVAQFLSREGIRNFLARLDIDESA